jgi:signal transduction histidine kinase
MNDIALLEALASQAAILIENARLVAEERRKTELMAILAHEIRNPLAGILGFSELLPEETTEMPPRFVSLMGRIHNDAQRLKRLVDNILELARLEAGKVEWSMKPVAVADLLRDVQAAYEVLASKKKIKLVASVAPALPRGLGNADRLFQVLSNLVGNALKFTPSSGTITMTARPEMIEPPPELLGASHDDLGAWTPMARPEPRPFVRIDVIDTGPGIPLEKRSLLFEKFAQGEEKRQHGVGLGLFISREIIRQHGGTIWVESNPAVGGGSCFSFRIPSTG